eukprot:jgi/Mesen1/7122/ME000369S06452
MTASRVLLLFVAAVAVFATSAAGSGCPAKPLSRCDFYLQGHKDVIPVLKLKEFKADTILTASLVSSVTNKPVISATSTACYFLPQLKRGFKCGVSFYFKGIKSPLAANHVAARVVQKGQLKNLVKRCVLLPIRSAQIGIKQAKNGTFTTWQWINPGDNSKAYKQSRRCVVFRTA